ncbi:hypothetical protein ACFQ9X_11310 [Catenulispora yoronensis]
MRAFLAEHPFADRLPILVTAVAAAQAGWGPPVLLIESDSDRAALWIGAVSYLLPPRAAGPWRSPPISPTRATRPGPT